MVHRLEQCMICRTDRWQASLWHFPELSKQIQHISKRILRLGIVLCCRRGASKIMSDAWPGTTTIVLLESFRLQR